MDTIIDCLKNGGVIIYPTDTGYAFGCDLHNKKAIERILQIKGESKEKIKNMSFICSDLKHIAEYATVSNDAYKIMKKYLPGPYTFILEATKNVSKIIQSSKKTVGIRVPDFNLVNEMVKELGHPLISSSVNSEEKDEVVMSPEELDDKYGKQVDYIITCGTLYPDLSTVLDLSGEEIEIIREGKGTVDWLVREEEQ